MRIFRFILFYLMLLWDGDGAGEDERKTQSMMWKDMLEETLLMIKRSVYLYPEAWFVN